MIDSTNRRALSWLLPMLFSHGVVMIGVGLLGTIVTLELAHQAIAADVVGAIQSAYFAGFAAGALAVSSLLSSHRVGWVFVGGAALGCAATLPMLLEPSVMGWAVLRFLQGACVAAVFGSMETLLNDATRNSIRGRVFAIYQVVTYVGMSLGQSLVGLLDADATRAFLGASTLYLFASVPAAWVFATRHGRNGPNRPTVAAAHTQRQRGFIQSLQEVPSFGLYAAAVSGVLLSAFYTVFPLVVFGLTGDLSATTGYLTVAFLAVIPPQFLVSYYGDLYGRLQAIVGISSAIGLALLILTFNSAGPFLWTAGLVYAGLIFCVYGLGVGDVNDQVSSEFRGTAATALLAAYALGGIVGPLATSWIYSEFGSKGYFISAFCVLASLLVAGLFALHRRSVRLRAAD